MNSIDPVGRHNTEGLAKPVQNLIFNAVPSSQPFYRSVRDLVEEAEHDPTLHGNFKKIRPLVLGPIPERTTVQLLVQGFAYQGLTETMKHAVYTSCNNNMQLEWPRNEVPTDPVSAVMTGYDHNKVWDETDTHKMHCFKRFFIS